MNFYYKTSTEVQPENQVVLWKHLAKKKNWRIVQLQTGFYQTERKDICSKACSKKECACAWLDVTRRETIASAEEAINESVAHFANKLEFLDGPKVVKTFMLNN